MLIKLIFLKMDLIWVIVLVGCSVIDGLVMIIGIVCKDMIMVI